MKDIHDMVGAYVLDALDESDALAFKNHLETCLECKRETAELSRVVGVLPLAVDMVAPSADLKNRILREVQGSESKTRGLTVLSGGAPARAKGRLAPWQGVAAAAAVVLAAAGAWNIGRHNGNSTSPNNAVAFESQIVHALAHGAQVQRVRGAHVPSDVQAVMVQPTQGAAYFVVDGMKSAPAGKVYELWLQGAHQKTQGVGVFTASTPGVQIVHLPIRASGWSSAGITVEPGPRGSAQPTTSPIMVGNLVA